MAKKIALVLALYVWCGFAQAALAQCAMCAATVESNSKTQAKSIATGLNTGILYLMIVPYLAFMTVGYFWYKNAKAQKAQNARRIAHGRK